MFNEVFFLSKGPYLLHKMGFVYSQLLRTVSQLSSARLAKIQLGYINNTYLCRFGSLRSTYKIQSCNLPSFDPFYNGTILGRHLYRYSLLFYILQVHLLLFFVVEMRCSLQFDDYFSCWCNLLD